MKIQRLIAILTILLQQDKISASQLATRFEVSIRTIYRDIEALEAAGIPLISYSGLNGGFGILEQYKIDKKLFTHQDITTLLISLQSVSGSMSQATLNQTLEKIKSLIPSDQIQAIELSSRQLHIDMTPWADNKDIHTILKTIQTALTQNNLLSFFYSGRNAVSTFREVEPHQLILKENNWYLRAFCHAKQEFRIFKLRRIKEIKIISQIFVPRDFSNTLNDFKDWQSIHAITIELLLDASLYEKALDFCKPEYMTVLANNQIHIKMPFVESEMGYALLLSFGHHCKCLGPKQVREELINRIQLMQKTYLPEE